MHVEVEMAIDVVQRQTGCAKLFKLGVDFGAQLFAQFTVEEKTPAATNRVIIKPAPGADQTRNLFRRQSRVATKQGQMKTDPQPRILPCQRSEERRVG